MHRLLIVLVLLVTGCAAGEPDALRPASACAGDPSPQDGPVLLQEPPTDVPGPFYYGRTDGPCGLLLAFIGAGEGDGPCNVAEYVGRVEPAGEDLRLRVEERHTGEQDDGSTGCTLAGHYRQMRVQLDAPLGDRRLLDEKGQLLHLVDGDRLLRPGALPEGWSATHEGQAAGGPAHWSFGLQGPDGASGDLRQGPAALAASRGGHGYQEVSRHEVRGQEAVLGRYDEQGGNHVLTWAEGDRGFALQVLGPLEDPTVLVELANGLQD